MSSSSTPIPPQKQTDNARSPIRLMAEILKDNDLNDEHKQLLYEFAITRFHHRRLMAYISLGGIFLAALAKFFNPTFEIVWITSPLFGIVAAYYGVAALRPNS